MGAQTYEKIVFAILVLCLVLAVLWPLTAMLPEAQQQATKAEIFDRWLHYKGGKDGYPRTHPRFVGGTL